MIGHFLARRFPAPCLRLNSVRGYMISLKKEVKQDDFRFGCHFTSITDLTDILVIQIFAGMHLSVFSVVDAQALHVEPLLQI